MSNKFTILGCGSSLGAPWITNYLGKLNKKNKKNLRSRCCAHIKYKNMSILIDTSPDIKEQIKKNNIKDVDAVVYTHDHADQTVGIFELRPFFWKNKKKIPVYGSKKTINSLKQKYTFCFLPRSGYKPIMKSHVFKEKFKIRKDKNYFKMIGIELQHGLIKANGFVFNKIAYLSDCNKIPHFNYNEALEVAYKLKAKKTILTNLHVDLDYGKLKRKLPRNIVPAYDGLSFSF